MIPQRFYLYERWIIELYDNAVDKINETNELDDLEKFITHFVLKKVDVINNVIR